jgi:hypothetical protein
MWYWFLTRLLTVAIVLLTVLGISLFAGASGAYPLEATAMSAVRGSNPLPSCTGNWSYRWCTENADPSASCWQKSQAQCSGTCAGGCSNQQASNQYCSSAAPWNAICDPSQNGTAPNGCGTKYQTGTSDCLWDDFAEWCWCSGTPGSTACARDTAINTGLAPNGCLNGP